MLSSAYYYALIIVLMYSNSYHCINYKSTYKFNKRTYNDYNNMNNFDHTLKVMITNNNHLNNNEYSTYSLHIPDKTFQFIEIIDDEIIENKIKMCSNGDIIFLKTHHHDRGGDSRISSDGVCNLIKGSWSSKDNAIHMIIERTLLGRYSTYKVKSSYITRREEISQGFVCFGGML